MFMWSDVNLIGNEIQVFKLTVDETTVVIWIAFFCIESTWLEFDCSFEFDCGGGMREFDCVHEMNLLGPQSIFLIINSLQRGRSFVASPHNAGKLSEVVQSFHFNGWNWMAQKEKSKKIINCFQNKRKNRPPCPPALLPSIGRCYICQIVTHFWKIIKTCNESAAAETVTSSGRHFKQIQCPFLGHDGTNLQTD